MNGVIYDGSMLSNTHVVNQSTPKKGNLEHANSLKSFLKQDSADKLDHDKLNELAERLTDLHHFYTLRIEQQHKSLSERNQAFLRIIDDLQTQHADKVSKWNQMITDCRKQTQLYEANQSIREMQQDVDQITSQSSRLKQMNDKLTQNLSKTRQRIKQKQTNHRNIVIQLQEAKQYFNELQTLQNKEQQHWKQIIALIDKTKMSQ